MRSLLVKVQVISVLIINSLAVYIQWNFSSNKCFDHQFFGCL